MKTLTGHQINECNQAITVEVDDPDAKYGNASHEYTITLHKREGDERFGLPFQRGPIKEVGTNGITHEVLLAILVDRLEGFQSGAFACAENAITLQLLKTAQESLHLRTKRRVERGVEGTNVV